MRAIPTRDPLRSLLVLMLSALAMAALAACGGGEAGEGTRPYTDVKGRQVMLPDAPQRIVALSEPTLDGLLALGITPVATTAARAQNGLPPYLADRAVDIPVVGVLGQPKLERVAELEPDLILADGTSIQDEAIVDKLSRIAPTVYVSRTGQDWREAFTALADVVDRTDDGERLLAEFDDRVEDIRGRLGDNAGAQISIVRWNGFGIPALILKELAASRTVTALGLTRPPAQDREGEGHSQPISSENLDHIDGDWVFLGALGDGGASGGVTGEAADVDAARRAIKEAESTPGFTRLRAYRAGRFVPVDGSAWTSAGGYLAEQVVLDDIERTLASPAS